YEAAPFSGALRTYLSEGPLGPRGERHAPLAEAPDSGADGGWSQRRRPTPGGPRATSAVGANCAGAAGTTRAGAGRPTDRDTSPPTGPNAVGGGRTTDTRRRHADRAAGYRAARRRGGDAGCARRRLRLRRARRGRPDGRSAGPRRRRTG